MDKSHRFLSIVSGLRADWSTHGNPTAQSYLRQGALPGAVKTFQLKQLHPLGVETNALCGFYRHS